MDGGRGWQRRSSQVGDHRLTQDRDGQARTRPPPGWSTLRRPTVTLAWLGCSSPMGRSTSWYQNASCRWFPVDCRPGTRSSLPGGRGTRVCRWASLWRSLGESRQRAPLARNLSRERGVCRRGRRRAPPRHASTWSRRGRACRSKFRWSGPPCGPDGRAALPVSPCRDRSRSTSTMRARHGGLRAGPNSADYWARRNSAPIIRNGWKPEAELGAARVHAIGSPDTACHGLDECTADKQPNARTIGRVRNSV